MSQEPYEIRQIRMLLHHDRADLERVRDMRDEVMAKLSRSSLWEGVGDALHDLEKVLIAQIGRQEGYIERHERDHPQERRA